MGRFTSLLCFCLEVICYTLAFPLNSSHGDFILHEKRLDYPDWKVSHRLEGHVNIPLRIGLKQQNLDSIPDYLMAVADPDSPTYGQHWSQEKVVEMFAPSSQANEAVHTWLMDAGFDPARLRLSRNKAWIDVRGATAMEVEGLLNTEYHVYKHDSGAEHVGGSLYAHFLRYIDRPGVIACSEYSLPERITEHIEMVAPTVQPNVKLVTLAKPVNEATTSIYRRKTLEHGQDLQLRSTNATTTTTSPGSLEGCDTTIVPNCLKTLYNMTYTPEATDRNTFGIG